MPDIGDIAGEQRPSLAPIRPPIVSNPTEFLFGGVDAGASAPSRIIVDTIGRVRDHQVWLDTIEQRLDRRSLRAVTTNQSVSIE